VKIAFVVHDYAREFGHGRYVVELAERFSKEHEVHVFANTYSNTGNPCIEFHRVPALRRNALSSILTFLVPASRVRRSRFDIVHSQGLCCFSFDVTTAHMCNRAWFRARLESGEPVTWRERVFELVVSPLEHFHYRRSTRAWVIAVSNRIREDLRRCYGRQERVSVIYHGVDLDRFSPAQRHRYRTEMRRECGVGDSDVLCLFVGNLSKGATPTLRALAAVPHAKLVFVTRSAVEAYRRIAGTIGVLDRVSFRPPTNQIEKYYAAGDAFVFPTPYESYGMVISEAMASGLPVITSRAAGAAELIEHGRDGFLLNNPSDNSEIAAYLERLSVDGALRNRLGQAARAVIEEYSWDRVAAQTMDLYRRILAERRL